MLESVMGEEAHPRCAPRGGHRRSGRVVGLVGSSGYGLTRLGLTMLAPHARTGAVAVVDVRGWLCPLAAWEAGVSAERLVVVRCSDRARWGQVTAALLGGIAATYAEVPPGTDDVCCGVWPPLPDLARLRSCYGRSGEVCQGGSPTCASRETGSPGRDEAGSRPPWTAEAHRAGDR